MIDEFQKWVVIAMLEWPQYRSRAIEIIRTNPNVFTDGELRIQHVHPITWHSRLTSEQGEAIARTARAFIRIELDLMQAERDGKK